MSYDKINYIKLKAALNSIDNINCNRITNLKNDISKSDWGSPICDRVKTAMGTLEKEYSNLKTKINNYKKNIQYIQDYQNAKDEYDKYDTKETQNYKDYLKYKSKYDEASDNDALKPMYKIEMERYYKKYKEYNDKKNAAKKSIQTAENKINSYIK